MLDLHVPGHLTLHQQVYAVVYKFLCAIALLPRLTTYTLFQRFASSLSFHHRRTEPVWGFLTGTATVAPFDIIISVNRLLSLVAEGPKQNQIILTSLAHPHFVLLSLVVLTVVPFQLEGSSAMF